MTLAWLQIYNLRNIETASIEFHPHFNVISGLNGAGKTSVLEAIYLLSTGRSFRLREVSPLIHSESNDLVLFAKMQDEQTLSVKKSMDSSRQLLINNQPCTSAIALAKLLPCQVIHPDIFEIIQAGSIVRRKVLDWGMFHVKHSYISLWQNYRKLLKQRNCLLKNNASYQDVLPWDKILSQTAEQIHQLRQDYFAKLDQAFKQLLPGLSNIECHLEYYKGWDRKNNGETLETVLKNSYSTDINRQFTYYGIHHADLIIHNKEWKIRQNLSRGQQKLILIALKLAQTTLVDNCHLLLDDIATEMDEKNLTKIVSCLEKLSCQTFISTVNPKFECSLNRYQFKIEAGKITRSIESC